MRHSFSTGIEVKTKGKHLFQHRGRRLDVKNVGLYGPGPESIRLDPVLNSDGYILVPRNFPICVWNFARRFAAGLTGTNRGASGPQSQCPSHVTAWLLFIDARFPWRQVKSRDVGFMGARDVGEEEVCRFEAVRQRVDDRT